MVTSHPNYFMILWQSYITAVSAQLHPAATTSCAWFTFTNRRQWQPTHPGMWSGQQSQDWLNPLWGHNLMVCEQQVWKECLWSSSFWCPCTAAGHSSSWGGLNISLPSACWSALVGERKPGIFQTTPGVLWDAGLLQGPWTAKKCLTGCY